jgi:hypothetical protein
MKILAIFVGIITLFISISAFAQTPPITSSTPDIIVSCTNNALPCSLRSNAAIKEVDGPLSVPIDSSWLASTIDRTGKVPLTDILPAPSVLGTQVGFSVCNQSIYKYTLSNSAAVLNGATSVAVEPWQCASIASNGLKYIVVLSWPTGNPPMTVQQVSPSYTVQMK